jgi:hypothetical protein
MVILSFDGFNQIPADVLRISRWNRLRQFIAVHPIDPAHCSSPVFDQITVIPTGVSSRLRTRVSINTNDLGLLGMSASRLHHGKRNLKQPMPPQGQSEHRPAKFQAMDTE